MFNVAKPLPKSTEFRGRRYALDLSFNNVTVPYGLIHIIKNQSNGSLFEFSVYAPVYTRALLLSFNGLSISL